MNSFIQSAKVILIMTVITGLMYPLFILGAAQLLFPMQANGSLIRSGNTIIGSELIGQGFESPRYFWPRPSATRYVSLPSGGSNSGPTSKVLAEFVDKRRVELANSNSGRRAPDDLLLASASGLDPHISPEAATFQVDRIARARQLGPDQVRTLRKLVDDSIEPYSLGFIGARRVNVLRLNLTTDSLFGRL